LDLFGGDFRQVLKAWPTLPVAERAAFLTAFDRLVADDSPLRREPTPQEKLSEKNP
jgi:hypothetical protein